MSNVLPTVLTALGCAEKIMALPAFTAITALKMVVDTGLVDGTNAAITPKGTPTFAVQLSASSSINPTHFILRIFRLTDSQIK